MSCWDPRGKKPLRPKIMGGCGSFDLVDFVLIMAFILSMVLIGIRLVQRFA